MQRRDRQWRARWALVAAGDVVTAGLAYLVAFAIRVLVPFPFTEGYLPSVRFGEVQHQWLALFAGQVAVLFVFGLYEARALRLPREQIGAFAVAAAVHALVLIAFYFFERDLVFPRTIFLVLAVVNATFLMGWRVVCAAFVRAQPHRRVLIVGARNAAAEVIDTIRHEAWLGMVIVGAVSDDPHVTTVADVPVLGHRSDVPRLCADHAIDQVILTSEGGWQDRLIDTLTMDDEESPRIYVVPSPYEMLLGRREHLRLHDLPLIELVREPPGGIETVTKRVFDVALALLLLVSAAPILILVAAAIGATSRGPVIFRQTRVGLGGHPFTIYKFRTMRRDAEQATGPILARHDDPRITVLGRILRAIRVDELPQLWNVIRGDMSFVGPRPERPEFVTAFAEDIQGYSERFRIRPGLTGYAQVNGEYHTSPSTKLKYDLTYLHNRSLWLDLKILSSTMKVLLTRRGV